MLLRLQLLPGAEDATPNGIGGELDSESCGAVDADVENAVDADVENAAEEGAGVTVLLTECEGHARD